MKTVFHINEPAKWSETLQFIKDLVQYTQDEGMNFDIELVATGGAAAVLGEDLSKINGIYNEIYELAMETVRFVACKNGLLNSGLRAKHLLPFVEVVDAGTTELIKKQNAGFAYVKF